MEDLKSQAQKRASGTQIRRPLGKLRFLENSMYAAHQNVLSHITIVSRALPKQKTELTTIETQIDEKFTSVFHNILTIQGGGCLV